MLATAGFLALAVIQSMPAMMSESTPEPLRSSRVPRRGSDVRERRETLRKTLRIRDKRR